MMQIQAGWTEYYSTCSETVMAPVTADGGNHISVFGYDASGNATADGSYSYTWNGESQLKAAAGVTYAYDGDGRRVSKSNGKLYWYGAGSEILAETDASGNTLNEYIFFGGKRVAILPAGSTAQYYVEDFLGSSRIVTANSGVVCYDADFTPFGGERPITNTCPQNNYKFEGKERDTETQNDEFGARYYTWRFGRWLSADWSAVPVPVPYATLSNPQTLNLYSMVSDDPESFADLDGHDGWDFAWGLLNSLANNWAGTQRDEKGNSDVKTGQVLGDALSFTVGGAVTITTVVGSATADVGSGGVALVLTPAEAVVAGVAGHAAISGGTNLIKDAINGPLEKSSFKPKDKAAVKEAADGKCEYCGQDTVKAEKSQKGVTPPQTEAQTDHYDPKGPSERANAVHSCRGCNRAKSDTPPKGTKWELRRMKKDPHQ